MAGAQAEAGAGREGRFVNLRLPALRADVLTEALGALYAFIMRTSSRAHAKQA